MGLMPGIHVVGVSALMLMRAARLTMGVADFVAHRHAKTDGHSRQALDGYRHHYGESDKESAPAHDRFIVLKLAQLFQESQLLLNPSPKLEGTNSAKKVRCDYPNCTHKAEQPYLHKGIRREEQQQPKPGGRGLARIERDAEAHQNSVKTRAKNDAK